MKTANVLKKTTKQENMLENVPINEVLRTNLEEESDFLPFSAKKQWKLLLVVFAVLVCSDK